MVLLKGSVVFKLNLSIIRPEYSALTRAIPDLLMTGFAWTSPAMILVKLDKRVLVVHGKGIYNLCHFRVDKRRKYEDMPYFKTDIFSSPCFCSALKNENINIKMICMVSSCMIYVCYIHNVPICARHPCGRTIVPYMAGCSHALWALDTGTARHDTIITGNGGSSWLNLGIMKCEGNRF